MFTVALSLRLMRTNAYSTFYAAIRRLATDTVRYSFNPPYTAQALIATKGHRGSVEGARVAPHDGIGDD
jgi:hypothetical protein